MARSPERERRYREALEIRAAMAAIRSEVQVGEILGLTKYQVRRIELEALVKIARGMRVSCRMDEVVAGRLKQQQVEESA